MSGNKPLSMVMSVMLIILLAVGAYLRLWGLSDWHYSPDNALPLVYVKESPDLWNLLKHFYLYWPHPPFFFMFFYWVLKFTYNPIVLLSIAWVPGLLSIIVGYFLGRSLGGRISGFFIAFTITFSYFFIVNAQIDRSYSLFVLSVLCMLLGFFRHNDTKKSRFLYLYLFASFVAILSHYAAFIPILAMGIVWISRVFRQYLRDKTQKARRLLFILLGIHLSLGALYSVQAYIRMESTEIFEAGEFQEFIKQEGMHLSANSHIRQEKRSISEYDTKKVLHNIGRELSQLPKKIRNMCAWYFTPGRPPFPDIFLVTFIAGILALLYKRRWDVLALLVAVFAINILTAALGVYPLGTGRRQSYFIPFLLIISSYGFHVIYNDRNKILGFALLSFFCLSAFLDWTLTTNYNVFNQDTLRRHARHYFRIKKEDLQEAVLELSKNLGKHDVIIESKLSYIARMYDKYVEGGNTATSFPEAQSHVCLRYVDFPSHIFPPERARQCWKGMVKTHHGDIDKLWIVGVTDYEGKYDMAQRYSRCFSVDKVISYETLLIVIADAKKSWKKMHRRICR